MAYKRNPMRSERICSLGRKLASLPSAFAQTYAAQIFERTLDDSAIRRIDIPEAYLLADALLILLQNVSSGLVVYPSVIAQHINAELPFMATENMIMAVVRKGGSRQEAHEKIRVLSHRAGERVKQGDGVNDLVDRVKEDAFFKDIGQAEWERLLDARTFVGRAPEQVVKFLDVEVEGALRPYRDSIDKAGVVELHV